MRVVESERIGHAVPILLACVFVAMVGFGITMPVLPFYTERLIATEASRRLSVAMHVSLLTSTYALTQLLFAPLWGGWSDKFGRRRLALIGIAGSALTQVLFGISNSLWLLHTARVLGGALSSAVSPAASAYVADATTAAERTRGMACLGTTSNLGVVAGLAVGGSLSRRDLQRRSIVSPTEQACRIGLRFRQVSPARRFASFLTSSRVGIRNWVEGSNSNYANWLVRTALSEAEPISDVFK